MAAARPEDVLRKQRLIDILVREKDSVLRSIQSLDNYFVRTTERERILSDGRLLKATADAFGIENPTADGQPTTLPDSIYKLLVEVVNLLNFRSSVLSERTIKEKYDIVNREKSSAVAQAVSVTEKQVARDVARVWEDRNERESADMRLQHSKDLEELAAQLSDEHEKEMHAKEHDHQCELMSVACDSKLKAVAQLADTQRKALDDNSAMWQAKMGEMREELVRERERAISAAVRAVEAGNRSQQSRIETRSKDRCETFSTSDGEIDFADAAAAIGRARLESQELQSPLQALSSPVHPLKSKSVHILESPLQSLQSPLPTPPRIIGQENNKQGQHEEEEEERKSRVSEEEQEQEQELRLSPIENLLRVTRQKKQMQHVLRSHNFLSSAVVVNTNVPTQRCMFDANETLSTKQEKLGIEEPKKERLKLDLQGSPHEQAVQWLCTSFASPTQLQLLQKAITSSNEKQTARDTTDGTHVSPEELEQGGGGGLIMKKLVRAKTMSLQLTRAARVPRGFPYPRFMSKSHAARVAEKAGRQTKDPSTPVAVEDSLAEDTRESIDMSVYTAESKNAEDDASVLEGSDAQEHADEQRHARTESMSSEKSSKGLHRRLSNGRLGTLITKSGKKLAAVSRLITAPNDSTAEVEGKNIAQSPQMSSIA